MFWVFLGLAILNSTSAEYVCIELGQKKKFHWGLACPVVSARVKVLGLTLIECEHPSQLLFLFLGNDSSPFALLPP